MADFWALMQWPCLAAMVMSPVHCLFGMHIIRRGVIFIDLAVAQMAALGMAVAVSQGHEPNSMPAYWMSLAFALGSALAIALSNHKLHKVPHEAIIGILFVLASALGIVVLEKSPHGLEELKDILGGSLLLVSDKDVKQIAMEYAVILLLSLLLWKRTSQISLQSDQAPKGLAKNAYDFAFYGLLAFVVASSVKVAGVLVVFSWLVMAPTMVFFWLSNMNRAAITAVPLGLMGSLLGLWLSFKFDWPTGPAVVVSLGVGVSVSYLARLMIPFAAESR